MTETPTRPPVTCTKCAKSVHWLEVFPGQICLDCYEAKMANVPVETFYGQIMDGFGGRK
jgi:hypothetical protein